MSLIGGIYECAEGKCNCSHRASSARYNSGVETHRRPPSSFLPIAAVVAAMVSVQSGASLAKSLFPVAGPVGMVTVRIGFGTLILCGVLRPWRARMTRQALPPLVVYGLALGTMNFLYYQALDRLPVGVAVAIEFLGPLTVAVFSSRRPIDFLWVLIATVGFTLLLPIFSQVRHANLTGALFALGAGSCWALYIVFGQRVGYHLGTQGVALGSIISAALIVPFGLMHARPNLFTPQVLLPGLAVAVLSTALPYTLEMTALTRLPTRTFGVLMSLEPAIAALSGLIFLGESLSGEQYGAILLVVVASLGATTTASPHVPAPVPD